MIVVNNQILKIILDYKINITYKAMSHTKQCYQLLLIINITEVNGIY